MNYCVNKKSGEKYPYVFFDGKNDDVVYNFFGALLKEKAVKDFEVRRNGLVLHLRVDGEVSEYTGNVYIIFYGGKLLTASWSTFERDYTIAVEPLPENKWPMHAFIEEKPDFQRKQELQAKLDHLYQQNGPEIFEITPAFDEWAFFEFIGKKKFKITLEMTGAGSRFLSVEIPDVLTKPLQPGDTLIKLNGRLYPAPASHSKYA